MLCVENVTGLGDEKHLVCRTHVRWYPNLMNETNVRMRCNINATVL